MGRAAGAQQASPPAIGLKSHRVGAGRLSQHPGGVPGGRSGAWPPLRASTPCLPPPAPRAQGDSGAERGRRLPEAGADGSRASRPGLPGTLQGGVHPCPHPSRRQLVRDRDARSGGKSKSPRALAGSVWRLREGAPRGGIKGSNKEHRPHPAVG